MIIANPLYDSVFKHMMENKAIAQFFIETLIDQKIEQLEVRPQEYTRKVPHYVASEDRVYLVSLYRLDFNAIIKTKEGERKNVLIEIQKASNLDDLVRFRNYLGDQYQRTHEVTIETINDSGVETKTVQECLPIITIYMLGFKLKEIDRAVIKVQRSYFDLILQEEVFFNSDFVNKLTHEAYVVQIPRIESKMRTSLERLLSVFEQHNFASKNKTLLWYSHKIDECDPVSPILHLLERVAASPEETAQLDNESEALRSIEAMIEASNKKKSEVIEEQAQVIEEQAQELEGKNQELEKEKEEKKLIKENLKKEREARELLDKEFQEMKKALEAFKAGQENKNLDT